MSNNVYMQKLPLILVSLILILCAGFILINCGAGPQLKNIDPDTGQFALDFTDCPGTDCHGVLDTTILQEEPNLIANKELTVEAWVKSKATSTASFTGGILGRFDNAGIVLYVKGGVPKVAIKRVVASGTSTATADYIANSNMTAIADALWHHIAGVLTRADHSAEHTDCTNMTDTVDCTAGGVTCNDDIHLDIYVDGVYRDCNTTYGASNDPATSPGYAGEPFNPHVVVGRAAVPAKTIEGVGANLFPGVIDETRLWRVARSKSDIEACMDDELSFTEPCSRMSGTGLISYMRFNEGQGNVISDWAGLGSGITIYSNTNPPPISFKWLTGWTTGAPLTKHD